MTLYTVRIVVQFIKVRNRIRDRRHTLPTIVEVVICDDEKIDRLRRGKKFWSSSQ